MRRGGGREGGREGGRGVPSDKEEWCGVSKPLHVYRKVFPDSINWDDKVWL